MTLSDEGWNFSGKLSCLYWLLRTVYTGSSAGPKDRVVVVSNFTRTLDLIQVDVVNDLYCMYWERIQCSFARIFIRLTSVNLIISIFVSPVASDC